MTVEVLEKPEGVTLSRSVLNRDYIRIYRPIPGLNPKQQYEKRRRLRNKYSTKAAIEIATAMGSAVIPGVTLEPFDKWLDEWLDKGDQVIDAIKAVMAYQQASNAKERKAALAVIANLPKIDFDLGTDE